MELTEELIKRRSKHFDLACVTHLDISNASIRQIANLKACVNTIQLNISANQLRDLEGLPALTALQALDLSQNQLSTLDDLPHLPALEELVLAHNQITSIDVQMLASKLPRLRKLTVSQNPIKVTQKFISQLRSALAGLQLLDGQAFAFYEVLLDETGSSRKCVELPIPQTPLRTSSGLKLPVFDTVSIMTEGSRRLEEMLTEAQKTLDDESQRVMRAFDAIT